MKLTLVSIFILFALNTSAQKSVLILQDIEHHDTNMQAETFKTILQKSLGYSIDIIISMDQKRWFEHDFDFSKYDLVVTSSLGFEGLPSEPLNELEAFIVNGGGLVVVHQGTAAYVDEPKFQRLIGLGWYGSHTGSHTSWNDEINDWEETPIYHGVGPAHGKQHQMVIDTRNTEHPITKGMPLKWRHGMDEFYHGMRGNPKNIEILATSYSDKKMWGSGEHEPIAWTLEHGTGKVFVTVLGHAFNEENANEIPGINSSENGTDALYCVGFQTLFARGAEWATNGKVTLSLPSDFPTENQTVILPPNEVKWSK
ncbi:MAG: ThuA domain-containing protein [Fulvivirga sp.]